MVLPDPPVAGASRRVVVAHRGASGYRPEHTLAAYELAIAQGADLLEPDLVATADGRLVVRHENEIGATTDVACRPRFADRCTTKVVDGVARTGWFSEDFTLDELRSLRARERLPGLRRSSAEFDGTFAVVSFEEVLELVARSRTAGGRGVGVLAELKHPTYFAGLGIDVEARLLADLEASGLAEDRITVQSFETASLRRLAERSPFRLGQLLEVGGRPYDLVAAGDPRTTADLLGPGGLAEIGRYADVVGLDKDLVIPRDVTGRLARPSGVTTRAHDVGLEVFAWTFRRENRFLPVELRRGDDPAGAGDLAGEIATFLAAGTDSVITDHPDVASLFPAFGGLEPVAV